MSIVYTDRDKCKECYACIRLCPAKAIRVREGLAEVIKERCVACGNCIQICVPQAKQAESDLGKARQFLAQSRPTVALLSAPFPAAFPELKAGQLISALKKLGFSEVMEDSFGAELVGREYIRLLEEGRDRPLISSTCPVVVSYIEKYYPRLIDYLVPVVSPMTAMGRIIKRQYNPDARVVFIGPCVAKKAEARDEKVTGVIDAVLTFSELKEMFISRGINPEAEPEDVFSGPSPNLGRLFAISGGMLKVIDTTDDIMANEVITAWGRHYMPKVVRECAEGNISTRLLSIGFCEGCIDGPVIDNDLSVFRRREIISKYTMQNANPEQTKRDIETYSGIDLTRKFTSQAINLPTPSEKRVQKILEGMGRGDPVFRIDCGACGYVSCRELAIAVCQGLAEIEMCWPYLLEKLRETQRDLIQAEKLTFLGQMAAIGQMAASIAHEVNNPLAGVLVYTQLLDKKIQDNSISRETAHGYLEKMESELTRSTKLIRNLLDFARQSPPTLKEIDVNEVVSQSLSLASHSAELQNIQVEKELSESLPLIMADFDQLQQVCTNLILNAVHSMPEGGRLTLRTSSTEEQVRIAFEDTGHGISKENLRKLFTPFFTTKVKGKGVGLGLAVAHGIVQHHQGKIEVQSEEGKGSTFTVYLPRRREGQEKVAGQHEENSQGIGS